MDKKEDSKTTDKKNSNNETSDIKKDDTQIKLESTTEESTEKALFKDPLLESFYSEV